MCIAALLELLLALTRMWPSAGAYFWEASWASGMPGAARVEEGVRARVEIFCFLDSV